MYGVSVFSMSQQLGITVEEAQEFMNDFDNAYPVAKAYMESLVDTVDKTGFVETACGRKRRFIGHVQVAKRYHAVCDKIKKQLGYVPENIWAEKKLSRDIKQAYWEVAKEYNRVARQSVNAVIQGSSADYIKMVMIRVYQYLQTLGEEYKLVGTIHDEILMEVPDTVTPDIIAELDRIMTNIEWFKFPVKTDSVVMYKWGEEIKINDWLEHKEEYNTRRKANG